MKTIGVFAIGSLGCVVALACGSWAVELAGRGTASVDQVVALGAAVLAAALGAWYGLTAVVVVLLRLAGESRHRAVVALRRAAGALGAPVLRRAVAAGAGAGLLLGISPAVADSGAAPGEVAPVLAQSAESEREVPADLRPGFLPDPGPEPESAGVATSTEETDTESDPPAPEPTAPGAAAGPEATSAPPSAPPGPPTGSAAANSSATARGRGPGATTVGLPAAASAESAASGESGAGTEPGTRSESGESSQPEASTESGAGSESGAGTEPAASTEAAAERYVVRPGDSLWSIAAEHLGGTPSDAQIAAAWPRWHAANRAVIGADPNLIHPGQELLAPDQEGA